MSAPIVAPAPSPVRAVSPTTLLVRGLSDLAFPENADTGERETVNKTLPAGNVGVGPGGKGLPPLSIQESVGGGGINGSTAELPAGAAPVPDAYAESGSDAQGEAEDAPEAEGAAPGDAKGGDANADAKAGDGKVGDAQASDVKAGDAKADAAADAKAPDAKQPPVPGQGQDRKYQSVRKSKSSRKSRYADIEADEDAEDGGHPDDGKDDIDAALSESEIAAIRANLEAAILASVSALPRKEALQFVAMNKCIDRLIVETSRAASTFENGGAGMAAKPQIAGAIPVNPTARGVSRNAAALSTKENNVYAVFGRISILLAPLKDDIRELAEANHLYHVTANRQRSLDKRKLEVSAAKAEYASKRIRLSALA